jgi:hypothetical protein
MQWEADHGYAGVVLVARDGKVVFHKAYGMANREKNIPMRPDTILAIGSTPIDFTKAGILLLKIDLDLARLIDAWPSLPSTVKRMILAALEGSGAGA